MIVVYAKQKEWDPRQRPFAHHISEREHDGLLVGAGAHSQPLHRSLTSLLLQLALSTPVFKQEAWHFYFLLGF